MSNTKFTFLLGAIVASLLITNAQLSVVRKQQEDTLDQVMSIQISSEQDCAIAYDAPTSDKSTDVSMNYDLIERVVAAEARGDTFEGMLAVCQTIKDRGDLWGMSYEEVVLQQGQFAAPYQGEISAEVKEAVSCVFDKGWRVTEEPITHFATYEPYWAAEKVSRGNCGSRSHEFWY